MLHRRTFKGINKLPGTLLFNMGGLGKTEVISTLYYYIMRRGEQPFAFMQCCRTAMIHCPTEICACGFWRDLQMCVNIYLLCGGEDRNTYVHFFA